MALFLLSFLVITVSVTGLALGVLMGRRPISAGCGRYGPTDAGSGGCDVCAAEDSSEPSLATQVRRAGTMAVKVT